MRTLDFTNIHSCYCSITHMSVVLTMARIYTWEQWTSKGWTSDDLSLVVRHIKSRIKAGIRHPEALKFSNLIGNVDTFEETLCEARALYRTKPVDPGKADVLLATHRPLTTPTTPPRTAGDVIRGNAELQKLLQLRDNL